MKKVFNNILLGHFLAVIVSFVILLFCFQTNQAYSTPIKDNTKTFPMKRPLNLFNLEESADTIFNLVQKVGAKPVANIQKTRLKKNENLSAALKRINYENYHINKIINSIRKLNKGYKILSSLPVGMMIHYSKPSSITGAALKSEVQVQRTIKSGKIINIESTTVNVSKLLEANTKLKSMFLVFPNDLIFVPRRLF